MYNKYTCGGTRDEAHSVPFLRVWAQDAQGRSAVNIHHTGRAWTKSRVRQQASEKFSLFHVRDYGQGRLHYPNGDKVPRFGEDEVPCGSNPLVMLKDQHGDEVPRVTAP